MHDNEEEHIYVGNVKLTTGWHKVAICSPHFYTHFTAVEVVTARHASAEPNRG